jgi:LacI family transcriptional regulator
MGSSITVRDIARHANVSHGTVSRVLNNHPNVSEENRKLVLQAATELGYFANRSMRIKSQPETRAITELGFLLTAGVDAGEQNFWMRILHGVEAEATKHAIKVSYRAIGNLVDNQDRLRSALTEMRLGHVLMVGDADPVLVKALEELNIIFVLIDTRLREKAVNAVVCDDYEATYLAVKYLISNGHERIAFLGNTARAPRNTPIYSLECRALGYMRAMQEYGFPYDELLYTDAGTLYVNDGYNASKKLLDNKIKFTALFCASDLLAVGAIKAINEAGLRVPDDISIIGEDSHMTSLIAPSLTTFRLYPEAMGATAVRQIVTMVNNPEAMPVVSILPIDLIVRESVAPVNRK